MTVYCEHCELDDALELVDGEIDATDGEFQFATLEYVCSRCSLRGTYRNAGDVETADNGLVLVRPEGIPIDEQRGVKQ